MRLVLIITKTLCLLSSYTYFITVFISCTVLCCIIKQQTSYFFSQPVPCKPTNAKASLRCNSNSAAVTWEPPSGALAYVAVGVTADGRNQTKCNNTMTYCDLCNLQCGQTYNVSVFGYDDSCNSVESDKAFVRTGIINVNV